MECVLTIYFVFVFDSTKPSNFMHEKCIKWLTIQKIYISHVWPFNTYTTLVIQRDEPTKSLNFKFNFIKIIALKLNLKNMYNFMLEKHNQIMLTEKGKKVQKTEIEK